MKGFVFTPQERAKMQKDEEKRNKTSGVSMINWKPQSEWHE